MLARKTERLRFGGAGEVKTIAFLTPSPGHSLPGQDTGHRSLATGKGGPWVWTTAKRPECRQNFLEPRAEITE